MTRKLRTLIKCLPDAPYKEQLKEEIKLMEKELRFLRSYLREANQTIEELKEELSLCKEAQ